MDNFVNSSYSLHKAVSNNNLEEIKSLLANGYDINERDNNDCVPLMYATTKNMVEFLIANGANINIKIIPEYYLMVTGYNMIEDTILTYMIYNSTIEAVEALIDNGGHIYLNDKYQIILSLAMGGFIKADSILMYELLHRKGANFNMVDNNGNTILHYLVPMFNYINNILEIITYFIEKGVNINIQNNKGETAFYTITIYLVCGQYYDDCRTKIIKLLIEKGGDITIKKYNGNTLLHHVIEQNNLQTVKYVKYLLENGLKPFVNDKNNKGLTALHTAINIISSYEETNEIAYAIIKLLIENGADINIKYNDGKTILHQAISLGYPPIVEYLLANNMDIHSKDNNDQTPLHLIGNTIYNINQHNIDSDVLKILYHNNKCIQVTPNTNNNILIANLVFKKWKQEYDKYISEFYSLFTFLKRSNIPNTNTLIYIINNHYLKSMVNIKKNLANEILISDLKAI